MNNSLSTLLAKLSTVVIKHVTDETEKTNLLKAINEEMAKILATNQQTESQ